MAGQWSNWRMADPLIAVIGSVQPARAAEIKLRNAADGERAAENIGRALARQRCRIVAYSDAEQSVEHLVVRGYVDECRSNSEIKAFAGTPERIEVPYSANDGVPQFPEQKDVPELFFKFSPDRNPSWASSFYRSLSQVDGVILMGGSHSTYIAGTVAISHRKPVAPIFTFGGAAEELWKELSPESGLLEQREIDLMTSHSWERQNSDTLVENLLKQRKRIADRRQEAEIANQRTAATRHVYISVPLLMAALSAIPFTWDNSELQRTNLLIILLLSPLLAGISGAAARTAFESVGGAVSPGWPNVGRTCGLGAIAGVIAGALFIVAQLVAMSPEISQPIWSKQAGRLVPFAVLIGFIAGLTLDAVFRKLVGFNVVTDEVLKILGERGGTRPVGST
jgi:hypothetical protein